MPVPSYGAQPLAKLFILVRILQVISMIVIIGLTANFISMIVSSGIEPPKEFVGTLSVVRCFSLGTRMAQRSCLPVQTCIATLYVLVSIAFFWSQANLGLFVMTGADSLLLIAFIVVAVSVGRPLSFLNCYVIGSTSAAGEQASAYAFTMSVSDNLNHIGNTLSLGNWVGTTKANCFETKTVWGLSIALWCVAARTLLNSS